MGNGASATPPSPSCSATPTTSPIATTCAATSASRRAFPRRPSTRAANLWRVETEKAGDSGGTGKVTARFVITAMGCLSSPNTPKIPGLEDFKGPTYHTGNWPHEGVDFTGKTVGVIGTGSSAIQSIPVMAEQAKHLTVFQRTANYTVPAHNKPLDPDYVREVKANYPEMRRRAKTKPAGIDFTINPASAAETPEEERNRQFQARWDYGGLGFMASFSDLLLNDDSNKAAADFVRAKIGEVVKDPKTAAALVPKNIIGCKRLCVDTGYWATFNRPNVTLVDISDEPIERITANGLRAKGEDYTFDCLVLATGFDAMTGALLKVDFRGPRWRDLEGALERGAEDLSRPDRRRLPQPVHDHRSGQPLGADQHASLDRAACRLHRRLPRSIARPRQNSDRAGAGSAGGMGRPCR
jgi:cation diffusion facilitator CzcD-associated flavoprotein CzcO